MGQPSGEAPEGAFIRVVSIVDYYQFNIRIAVVRCHLNHQQPRNLRAAVPGPVTDDPDLPESQQVDRDRDCLKRFKIVPQQACLIGKRIPAHPEILFPRLYADLEGDIACSHPVGQKIGLIRVPAPQPGRILIILQDFRYMRIHAVHDFPVFPVKLLDLLLLFEKITAVGHKSLFLLVFLFPLLPPAVKQCPQDTHRRGRTCHHQPGVEKESIPSSGSPHGIHHRERTAGHGKHHREGRPDGIEQ